MKRIMTTLFVVMTCIVSACAAEKTDQTADTAPRATKLNENKDGQPSQQSITTGIIRPEDKSAEKPAVPLTPEEREWLIDQTER